MIRTGTVRFWDMYWQPGGDARAVSDAGLRAMIGAPLFDARRRRRADALARAAREPRELAEGGPRSRRRSPRTPSTRSAESLRWIAEISAERGCPIQIHLSETEREVPTASTPTASARPTTSTASGCSAAHGARPRRLARPGELELIGERERRWSPTRSRT